MGEKPGARGAMGLKKAELVRFDDGFARSERHSLTPDSDQESRTARFEPLYVDIAMPVINDPIRIAVGPVSIEIDVEHRILAQRKLRESGLNGPSVWASAT